ncbi:MAG: hypothetical protein Q9174_004722 [Haloplaca sp. 1 TL-2023]
MELSSAFLPTELPWLEISIALLCVTAACSIFYLSHDVECPIHYEIPVPEQCKPGWTGKVLEEPSIKITGSSAIQCYNPATGQLLGQVNPATPDGIDRAISKATEAQKEWAKTSFGQRRKVLRTMLKYAEVEDAMKETPLTRCPSTGSYWTTRTQ